MLSVLGLVAARVEMQQKRMYLSIFDVGAAITIDH